MPAAALSEIPYIKGLPLIGLLRDFQRDAPGVLLKAQRAHGDLVRINLGSQEIYEVSHPDWIRDIFVTHQHNFTKSRMLQRAMVLLGEGLLTSEGQHHTRQRRLVQPAFHRDRLKGYGESMVECARQTRDQWKPGATYDIAREMNRLTLAIVAKTLFSADVSDNADEIGAALTEVLGLFEMVLMPFSEILEKMPIPAVRRFKKARATLDRIIYGIIADRRKNPRDTGDLLSMLLLARDAETDGASANKGMTDQQVRDEAMTLFLAGHETTANALAWTWYLLAQNPEAEAKLHASLPAHEITYDDLPTLKYAEQVFAESMRLYPPAWGIGRRNIEPYKIGDHELPARSIILMSPYVVHRDPRWFQDPETFRPERFESDDRPKFSYFPFGGGARVCIGERFAWMEGVLLLATLAQRWKIRVVEGHPVETRALITLRPKHGIACRIEPR
jgi:cytochrome P450